MYSNLFDTNEEYIIYAHFTFMRVVRKHVLAHRSLLSETLGLGVAVKRSCVPRMRDISH